MRLLSLQVAPFGAAGWRSYNNYWDISFAIPPGWILH
jgi:hypothetical protein